VDGACDRREIRGIGAFAGRENAVFLESAVRFECIHTRELKPGGCVEGTASPYHEDYESPLLSYSSEEFRGAGCLSRR
jgi:hypothetical protein